MNAPPRKLLVACLLLASMALLVPGILLPALTVRGVLTREGIAQVAPIMLERGLDDETVGVLQSMMNPAILAVLKATGGDVRKIILEQLGPRISAALQQNVADVEVYTQTRSIIGAIQRLYEVGSPVPATLILLFSVVVPIGKALLAAWAVFLANPVSRGRTLRFVEAIAKWSMADVFVWAVVITFLAAQASTAPPTYPAGAAGLRAFTAAFGPGLYWFAAYCLFSLASQQLVVRLAARGSGTTANEGAWRL